MVMSLEKYVLLRAKVLKMNSKSLEVDGAEEHRLHIFKIKRRSLGKVRSGCFSVTRQDICMA